MYYMNSNLQAVLTLSWILLVLISLFEFGSCATTNIQYNKDKPAKYLELDDLNAFESSPTGVIVKHDDLASEEAIETVVKKLKTKKLVKRDAAVGNSVQENTKQGRKTRQNQVKQKPGFFWTIARVTYETFNDTRSTIQQVREIINNAIPSEPPKKKPSSGNLKKPISQAKSNIKDGNATDFTPTTLAPSTTTKFQLTGPLLQSIVRRNVKGLVRLFNIEWKDAMDQSRKNIQEFRSDLGKQLSFYLRDNPNNY